MRHHNASRLIVGWVLFLFLLPGCSAPTEAPAATPLPPSNNTPPSTATVTPTLVPTATPLPIPAIPTYEVLDDYSNPMVELMDTQGKVHTLQVERIETGDTILNEVGFLGFPLMIAENTYILLDWEDFQRAYRSNGEFIVNMVNDQEFKGQLDITFIDEDGTQYNADSIYSMILVGLAKTSVPFIGSPAIVPPGKQWEVQLTADDQGSFTLADPKFEFEYTLTTLNSDGSVLSVAAETGYADFFSLGYEDVSRKLTSYDEIRFEPENQVSASSNGTEVTGTLFLIPDFINGITFREKKGEVTNWYLQGIWVEQKVPIFFKVPICKLTKVN